MTSNRPPRHVPFISKRLPRLAGLILGIGATAWYLTRVIPKPSRAGYPCMRASFPIMSAFVSYLTALLGALASARLLRRERILRRPSSIAAGFLFLACVWSAFFVPQCGSSDPEGELDGQTQDVLGQGQGIFPGRVVWIHDPNATNENCTNVPGDGYFLPWNSDQSVIDRMLAEGMTNLTGASTVAGAWDALFNYFNNHHQKGQVGYRSGERIFIKINATSSWNYGTSWGNIADDFTIRENSYYGVSETSPRVVLALLKQLIEQCGVAQSDITVGDPMKDIYQHAFELWHDAYPNVIYLSAHEGGGRTRSIPSADPLIFYSDRGSVLREGAWDNPSAGNAVLSDHLYTIHEQANYLINVPALKGHNRAGTTLSAKNHFGSVTRGGAIHLHMGLVEPAGADQAYVRPNRRGYGLYRVQVDLMGHRLLGGNTLLHLIDGLWGGPESVDPPVKWQISPFNGDWSSSLLLSQDHVAIESVGYDLLKEEFTETRHPGAAFPQMLGVDDYLHQAADSSTWPAGIVYDPENDGTPITSLGVHEHWDNATNRRYSRNRGESRGIELISVFH